MNIEKENIQKEIERIPHYALLIYVTLTILIMIWAFLKNAIMDKGTPNDTDKFFRLVNFLWLPPLKIYIILNTMVAIIELFKQLFGIVFVKNKNEEFPPAFLFFLNYGIIFCLILYALFPKMIYIIIIFAVVVSFMVGIIPIIMTELGLMPIKKKTNKKETIFPFQLSKIAKTVYNQFEKMKNSSESHVIEIIWLIVIIAIVFLILYLSVIGILIMIILSSYFVVFVYTFRIPMIPKSMKGLSMLNGSSIMKDYLQKKTQPLSIAKGFV